MAFGLGDVYNMAMTGDRAAFSQLQPAPVRYSLVKGIQYQAQTWAMEKALQRDFVRSEARAQRAAVQGTVVNATLDAFGLYGQAGQREKTGITFAMLRRIAADCEPVAAIISKRIDQVTAFAVPSKVMNSRSKEPGFRLRLTDTKAKATTEDEERMTELTQFFARCGYTQPPKNNRRPGWQPGFPNFLAEVTRDRLTLDHVAVRKWCSAADPESYPIVSFAAEDAGAIFLRQRQLVDIEGYVKVEEEWHRWRDNTDDEITYVKTESEGGSVLEEFTESELFCVHQRPRTDRYANGYGFSEIEEYLNGAAMWCAARDFNLTRFSKNSLPRGVLSILGNLNEQQFQAFQMQFKQSMQGLKNAWNIPIVRGSADTGSSIQWIPFDPSPKDLEHSQTIFITGLWAHILYRIHPEETGFQAANPYRPPLSEASPEAKLQWSQDTGLRPLLQWIANWLNEEILWVMDPTQKYSFEFVGLGDYDVAADAASCAAMLDAGMVTPKMMWDERDIVMPDEVANHPAANFPAPFMAGFQLLEQMKQAREQQEMAKQQQEAQAQQQQAGSQQQQEQLAQQQQLKQQELEYKKQVEGQRYEHEGRKLSLAERQAEMAAEREQHQREMAERQHSLSERQVEMQGQQQEAEMLAQMPPEEIEQMIREPESVGIGNAQKPKRWQEAPPGRFTQRIRGGDTTL